MQTITFFGGEIYAKGKCYILLKTIGKLFRFFIKLNLKSKLKHLQNNVKKILYQTKVLKFNLIS
jgi:hypothetical protein